MRLRLVCINPIAEHDNKKIKALMQLYKSAYQKIGIIILVVGLSLVPFLKYLVKFSAKCGY